MPKSYISATLLPASAILTPGTAATITVTAQTANDLVAAVHQTPFTHDGSAMSKQRGFQAAVEREILFLLNNKDLIYEWWIQINTSQPQGNVWANSTTHYYAHPRRGGAVIAVQGANNTYRYLDIQIPI